MLRKQKWALLGGLILLAMCMIIPGVAVMASGSTVGVPAPFLSTYPTCRLPISPPLPPLSHGIQIILLGSSVTSQVSYGITTGYGSNVSDTFIGAS